jgi:leucyl aminopeptidase (aminopeptidase T)
MDELIRCAEIALTDCINLKRNEQLLLIYEPATSELGRSFYSAAVNRCKEVVLVMMPSRKFDGNELPSPVSSWMAQFETVILATEKALTYKNAAQSLADAGTRLISMPGITSEIFIRTMQADFRKLGVFTRKIAGKLNAATSITVKSDFGTDFTFDVSNQRAAADDGRVYSKGASGNLPAGEAFIVPVENSANGTVIIDGPFTLADNSSNNPLILIIKEGKVVKAEGNSCAAQLEKLFTKYHNESRFFSVFGIGTNECATRSGLLLEETKALGNAHLILGDNSLYGGDSKSAMYFNGVIRQPSIWFDGKVVFDKGSYV